MLIPYTTDAPVYYWPFATVGLIVANVVIFFAVAFRQLDSMENWVLWYGDGLHADQWIKSLFMHASMGHLVGNMIFLWVFGLVVEGKLGWWKFLCLYLAIGVLECMLEQMVMSGVPEPEPGSLGASAAIMGLIGIAAIWAPKNEVTFFWMFMFRADTFDVSIAVLAVAYVCYEIVMILVFSAAGMGGGSSWLHLAGFAIGVPFGIVLLKRGIVDCEGWDAFHVWSGDYGAFKKEPDRTAEYAAIDAKKKTQDEQLLSEATKQFRVYLRNKHVPAAIKLYDKMKEVRGGLKPEANELLAMIQALHVEKRWKDSAPHMADFIARFPQQADAMRIKLAQICVVELQRPAKAIELLAALDVRKLPEKQAALVRRIRAKAQQIQMDGVVELEVETW